MLRACPGRDEYLQNFEIQIIFAVILIQITRASPVRMYKFVERRENI
jgi:hypothetical protein